MDYSIITAPLIGAIIGYATNQIAVKMLFRPLRPITIGKYTLPFTPGIIPKGKPRLAKAVGTVVGNSLLTKENLKQSLLSEDMKQKVTESIHASLNTLNSDTRSIKDLAINFTNDEKFEQQSFKTVNYVTNQIDSQLQNKPIGDFIGDQAVKAIKANLQGGLLSKLINDSVLHPIGVKISQEVDEYIKEHGKEVVQPIIEEEYTKIVSLQVGELSKKLTPYTRQLEQAVLKLYESIIDRKLEAVFESINIPKIIETQIMNMDVLELENLILSVMKKELRAIVNLGALIGFVLGLINLLF